jgi:hypothetical protein
VEIRADKVTITNPVWLKFLASVISRVYTGLGVYPARKEVQAKLYKRLLYEKDARFKPIRKKTVDNIRPVQAANLLFIWEKCPGTFRTLVIILLSRHTGSEVYLAHADKSKVFHASKFSEFGMIFVAW